MIFSISLVKRNQIRLSFVSIMDLIYICKTFSVAVWHNFKIKGQKIGEQEIKVSMYADNVALFTESDASLFEFLKVAEGF